MLSASATAWAGIPTFCDRADKRHAPRTRTACCASRPSSDELGRSGSDVALVARSGLDLDRFGLRYSHAGVALKDKRERAVVGAPALLRLRRSAGRACSTRAWPASCSAPTSPTQGYVSLVLLPRRAGRALLERAALDNAARPRAAGRDLQRQRLPLQHPLPELQPVGGGADRVRVGPPRPGAIPRAPARRRGCARKAMRPRPSTFRRTG